VLPLIGLALAALVLAAAPAAAQDRLDAAAAALDRATAQPKTETAAVGRMAAILKVAPEALRAQRATARLGWGDFFIAHRIAMRGAQPVDKVFAARRTGAGWSEIADEANVSTDALVQDVAIVSPEAAKAAAPPTTTAPAAAAPPKDEPTGLANPAQEDIRDKMIRGGGRPR